MLPNGHADIQTLLCELNELHANTYRWIYRPGSTNLEDLKAFLPLARAQNIRVWVNVNPPSERPKDIPTERLRADYEEWAADLARLSLTETNLIAWSIDDFVWNLKFFTPEYLEKVLAAARAVNPKFAFASCCYFKGVTPEFVKKHGAMCDGIIFPYRDESGGANLQSAAHVASEVEALRKLLGPRCAIVVSIYSTRHSKLGDSTPEYVQEVLQAARPCADSVSIYCHPRKSSAPAKYVAVQDAFAAWPAASAAK